MKSATVTVPAKMASINCFIALSGSGHVGMMYLTSARLISFLPFLLPQALITTKSISNDELSNKDAVGSTVFRPFR